VPTTHPLFGAARYLGGDPAVDGALSDGTVRVERGEQSMRAVVPLKVHGSIVGALVILKMLDHKPTLSEDDKELLQLIASHAATALFAARTYTKANRKMRTLEQLVQLIRADNDTAAYVRGEQVA
jgi:transcriptional regulator with GAF, ATPase, and Fis domain